MRSFHFLRTQRARQLATDATIIGVILFVLTINMVYVLCTYSNNTQIPPEMEISVFFAAIALVMWGLILPTIAIVVLVLMFLKLREVQAGKSDTLPHEE